MISEMRIEKLTLCLVVNIVAIALSEHYGGKGNSCGDLKWSCATGECIAVEQLCDGTKDCPDGSDEALDNCPQDVCPPFTYRCAYNECIMDTVKCNDGTECADKSEDVQLFCKNEEPGENTNCIKDKFQCASGDCISLDDVCDGHADCSDKSDETVNACASTSCSSIFFRCGYGACIKADKKCDGVQDCFDGSDEAFSLCGDNPISRKLMEPTSVTQTRTTIPVPTTTILPEGKCLVPNITRSRMVLQASRESVVEPGQEVLNLTQVAYECERHFHLVGALENMCFNGKWFKDHPVCIRYCTSDILKSTTFEAVCVKDGRTYECNDRIEPETLAYINCKVKYTFPQDAQQTLKCNSDGEWDYSPSRCVPSCGEELVSSKPFVSNGQSTDITTVPWHVGVYEKKKSVFENICGGSLINPKVVLSAAHCFWDEANENAYNKELYTIVAGKYFRDFYVNEQRKVQKQTIAKIVIPIGYKGSGANFRADIAVIVLTNAMILSEFVSPICIHWKDNNEKSVPTDSYGQVAGWGLDEFGIKSDELRTIFVPPSSYEECKKEARRRLDDSMSITDDKFCVLNKHFTNACEGDSGGGFTIKSKGRSYLWGVVSNGLPRGKLCTSTVLVTYTNIQHYANFIRREESYYRPR